MASDHQQYYFCFRKLLLVLFLLSFLFVSAFSEIQQQRKQSIGGRRRRMLGVETEEELEEQPVKKKSNLSTKNQTKLIKPIIKNSNKNSTISITLPKTLVKKLNSTKSSNSTSTKKSSSSSSSLSLDLSKSTTPKNKTQTTTTTKLNSDKKQSNEVKSKNPDLKSSKNPDLKSSKNPELKSSKTQSTDKKPKQQKSLKPITPIWMDDELDEDLVSEFKDLPSQFHQTLLPDLERMSTTSKAYIYKANREITEGFKPIVGNKYASTIASLISCIFILAPLLLVSLIFNRFKAYFSLQKILIFIQIYLSIYFSILSLSAIISGLEPLKFFYATSQSSYICLQVLQTLGYVLYLLVLLMYLVLVFSTDTGFGSKFLGLVQTFVGFAVGLHYYVTVFHRAVLHQPPKTNWKVHGIYATCFLVICLLTGAERRKKAYLEEGGDEGKKS